LTLYLFLLRHHAHTVPDKKVLSLTKVLHLVPHLGGGLGRFCKNVYYKDEANEHRFLLFEEPRDANLLPEKSQWALCDTTDFTKLCDEIESADIIQIDFWNHPLIYYFLAQLAKLPKSRLVIYPVVSGLFPPQYLPPGVVEVADVVILPSEASKLTDAYSAFPGKCQVIPVYGGASRTLNALKKEHNVFRFLYVGTADFAKLNPNVIEICTRVIRSSNRPIEFFFVLQDDYSHLLKLIPADVLDSFRFEKIGPDIQPVMEISDVFAYPLNPFHYGAGEQAILEAMGASLPIVVLNNPAEASIVRDLRSGIVCISEDDFVEALLMLAEKPDVSNWLGANGREFVTNEASSVRTCEKINKIYEELLTKEKTKHELNMETFGSIWSPYQYFIISQGPHGPFFEYVKKSFTDEEQILIEFKLRALANFHSSSSKGGIRQWTQYFPDDTSLNELKMRLTQ
jgi:glycosyltransferase involved in cell wall biosynthesis